MYELCQKWQGTDGFRISVDELRKAFILEEKYNRYALLNECAPSCKTRIKRIVRPQAMMFILNSPKNEKAEPLKCYVSNCSENTMNVKLQTIYSWN
jgi:hypothetical protein